jgi:hypothetical protein
MTRIRTRAAAALAALGALAADMAAAFREAFRPADLAPYVGRLESAAGRLESAADHLAACLAVADALAAIGGAS